MKTGLLGAVAVFDYAPGPCHQEVGDIDWICLTSAETTYPHIRIHDLRQEDGLSFFMSTMASTPAALAVIFVNSENNFRYIHVYLHVCEIFSFVGEILCACTDVHDEFHVAIRLLYCLLLPGFVPSLMSCLGGLISG